MLVGRRRLIAAAALLTAAVVPAIAGAKIGGGRDSTFGQNGAVVTPFAGSAAASDLVLQPDGALIAVGTALGPDASFAAARYGPSGSLDTTFGTGGLLESHSAGRAERAFGAALDGQGRLDVAGTDGRDFALARYSSTGNLDAGFGQGGWVFRDFGGAEDRALAVLVQPDGKLVVVGQAGRRDGSADFGLARYDDSGRADPGFAGGGAEAVDMGGFDVARAAALSADGKILVAGYTATQGGGARIALARFDASGALDTSFGDGGRVITDLPGGDETANGIAVQPDGRIVVSVGRVGGLVAARYRPGGALDPSFGRGGVATVDAGGHELAGDVVLQRNGKIVLFGNTLGASGPEDFAIGRLLPTGKADPAFGKRGYVRTDIGGLEDAEAVAVQADGRLVAAGSTGTTTGRSFAVVRYLQGTCSVPKLTGRTLAAAKRRLAAADCRLGKVRTTAAPRRLKHRVTSQSPRPGVQRPDWATVAVTVGR